MYCSNCGSNKNIHYTNDRYCIICRRKKQLEYYHKNKHVNTNVKNRGRRSTAEELAFAIEYNKKHPFVRTLARAYIEHQIFTGRIAI